MNNIEKFHTIQQISRLKSELHKRELVNLITFNSAKSNLSKQTVSYLEMGKTGFTIFKVIKSFFNK